MDHQAFFERAMAIFHLDGMALVKGGLIEPDNETELMLFDANPLGWLSTLNGPQRQRLFFILDDAK